MILIVLILLLTTWQARVLEELKNKVETLVLFISTNAYIIPHLNHATVCVSSLSPPAFLSRFIEQFLCKTVAPRFAFLNDASPKNQVFHSIDEFHFNYLSCPVFQDGEAAFIVTLGPFVTERISSAELRYITHKMKLGSDAAAMLETFFGVVPYYPDEVTSRLASLLQSYIRSSLVAPELITEDFAVIQKDECRFVDEKFVDFDFVEENYAAEAKILSAIERGDVESVRRIFPKKMGSFYIPPRYPNDPLRELKNLSITLNSISLRAAIKGGLSQSVAHNMSHTFAILIEQQTDRESLRELDLKMIVEYAQAVRDYGLKNHSELVTKTICCIRRDLASPMSLSSIAKQLSVSPEHLCRQFANETGMNLTEFIHKTKILESCSLLASRKFTISEIALTFGYSSPSHYTKMFERHMGSTPKRWQAKNSRSDPTLTRRQ